MRRSVATRGMRAKTRLVDIRLVHAGARQAGKGAVGCDADDVLVGVRLRGSAARQRQRQQRRKEECHASTMWDRTRDCCGRAVRHAGAAAARLGRSRRRARTRHVRRGARARARAPPQRAAARDSGGGVDLYWTKIWDAQIPVVGDVSFVTCACA
jgi:hypothetical protein